MSVVITASGNHGPFKTIEVLDDRLRCDDTDLPFSVIGEYEISEDDDLAPVPYVDLAALKAAKNAQINQWRAEANFTTFPHADKLIACDALSRSDIDAVAGHINLFGTFPAGFPGAWKNTDNSYVMLPNVDAFKAMYTSMTSQGTANFNHSQTLKGQLAAATTAEQVAAISW